MRQCPFESNGYFCITRLALSTNGIVAVANPLIGGQRFQAHRPTGVQLLGADRHLRAEAELAAVGEASRSVNVYRRRIHFINKAIRMAQGTRQNGIGMLGAVRANMGNRLIEIGNNFHVQIQR